MGNCKADEARMRQTMFYEEVMKPRMIIEDDPQLGLVRPITPIVALIAEVQSPHMALRWVIGQPQLSYPFLCSRLPHEFLNFPYPWNLRLFSKGKRVRFAEAEIPVFPAAMRGPEVFRAGWSGLSFMAATEGVVPGLRSV